MKNNILVGILMVGSSLLADTVVPPGNAGGAGWQQMTDLSVSGEVLTGTLNNPGGSYAYWNNSTSDSGSQCANIGCFVTKKSYFANNTNSPGWATPSTGNPATFDGPVYLGNDNGSAVDNFYFAQASGGSTSMKAEVAEWAANNWLGWYDKSKTLSALTSNDFGLIFAGSQATGASATFAPGKDYGLWFLSNYTGTNWQSQTANFKVTQSDKNATGNQNQYFSVFASSAAAAMTIPVTYYVGIEDTNMTCTAVTNGPETCTGGDRDYNDMVISLTVVPEPGFYGVLALGFAGLGFARRRRK